MVTVSCSGKLHAFALAEQLEKNKLLDSFFTTYAYQKNTYLRKYVKRIDKEEISVNKIHTNIPLAFPIKLMNDKVYIWNNWYDKWVASKITKSNSKVFIGWSGMSLHSIRTAKKRGIKTIVERGSAHILFQDKILKEEYKKFGINFSVHPVVIKKELKEYEFFFVNGKHIRILAKIELRFLIKYFSPKSFENKFVKVRNINIVLADCSG